MFRRGHVDETVWVCATRAPPFFPFFFFFLFFLQDCISPIRGWGSGSFGTIPLWTFQWIVGRGVGSRSYPLEATKGDGWTYLASTTTGEAHRHGRVPVVPTWKRGPTHGMQALKTNGNGCDWNRKRTTRRNRKNPTPSVGNEDVSERNGKHLASMEQQKHQGTEDPTKHTWVRSDRPPKKTRKLHHETKVEIRVYQCPPFSLHDVGNPSRSVLKRGAYDRGFPRHVSPPFGSWGERTLNLSETYEPNHPCRGPARMISDAIVLRSHPFVVSPRPSECRDAPCHVICERRRKQDRPKPKPFGTDRRNVGVTTTGPMERITSDPSVNDSIPHAQYARCVTCCTRKDRDATDHSKTFATVPRDASTNDQVGVILMPVSRYLRCPSPFIKFLLQSLSQHEPESKYAPQENLCKTAKGSHSEATSRTSP